VASATSHAHRRITSDRNARASCVRLVHVSIDEAKGKHQRPRRLPLKLAAALCWPLVAGLLFVTSNQPPQGVRWADANTGRGTFLAITFVIWAFAMLLWAIWTVAFGVVVPAFEKRRERPSGETSGR
jgi:hypothetical protein